MATCPLCSARAGKRYCPAKDAQICAVCCGTKREIEIDFPSSCAFLKASRSYEEEKRIPDADLAAKAEKFNDEFLRRYFPYLDSISLAVAAERENSPWLVDNDVHEVYKALSGTMKTLSSGIYYESLPEGPIRLSLFRRLKAVIDEMMHPTAIEEGGVLKVSEAIDVLDCLTLAAELNSSVRPRSRRYLDMISEFADRKQQGQQPGGLIIP
jgi:hypothetical protein